jgi:hypothetical protein
LDGKLLLVQGIWEGYFRPCDTQKHMVFAIFPFFGKSPKTHDKSDISKSETSKTREKTLDDFPKREKTQCFGRPWAAPARENTAFFMDRVDHHG